MRLSVKRVVASITKVSEIKFIKHLSSLALTSPVCLAFLGQRDRSRLFWALACKEEATMKSFKYLREALEAQRAATQKSLDNFHKATGTEPAPEVPTGSVTVHCHHNARAPVERRTA